METAEEKQFRLREVRAFLLFQCKVLKNHRKRKVVEAEQEPQFLVGSGMAYELQKMEEFLTQSETVEQAYLEVILFIKKLRLELEYHRCSESNVKSFSTSLEDKELYDQRSLGNQSRQLVSIMGSLEIKNIISEYYQRCFGEDLQESLINS